LKYSNENAGKFCCLSAKVL